MKGRGARERVLQEGSNMEGAAGVPPQLAHPQRALLFEAGSAQRDTTAPYVISVPAAVARQPSEVHAEQQRSRLRPRAPRGLLHHARERSVLAPQAQGQPFGAEALGGRGVQGRRWRVKAL